MTKRSPVWKQSGWKKINEKLYKNIDGRSIWYGPCTEKWYWNRGRSKSATCYMTHGMKTPDSSCREGDERDTFEEALKASEEYKINFTIKGAIKS